MPIVSLLFARVSIACMFTRACVCVCVCNVHVWVSRQISEWMSVQIDLWVILWVAAATDIFFSHACIHIVIEC